MFVKSFRRKEKISLFLKDNTAYKTKNMFTRFCLCYIINKNIIFFTGGTFQKKADKIFLIFYYGNSMLFLLEKAFLFWRKKDMKLLQFFIFYICCFLVQNWTEETILFEIKEGNQNLLVLINAYPYKAEGADRILKGKVFDKKELSFIQTFEDKVTGTLFQDYKVEDVNFDGYLDFYYVNYEGNHRLSFSAVWVWNPKKNCFEHAKELENIVNFSVDAERKMIVSWFRGGLTTVSENYYQYLNGKLECVRSLDIFPNYDKEGDLNLVCKDWRNGKLETIIETQAPLKFAWSEEEEEGEKFSEIDEETKQQVEEFWKYYYDIDYPEKK